ncbi:rRNA maturation RNase YbeY [Sulfitobacter sp. HNIBRBA2951]|uniref:rRNA maturation RNase YbeY n=1 Tax=Sulfitobacter aquimarinus TaxID=3158557 RepID=UPI0032DE3A59
METLDIVIDAPEWADAGLADAATRAVAATLAHMGLEAETCEITLLGCDDARIAELNTEFRGKPQPTNVLSWPAQPLAPIAEGHAPPAPEQGFDGMIELGDIAIAYQTCTAEAAAQNKPLFAHMTHLIVHGTLHLLGYDHETDADAALMERLEVEILGNLGMDDPYNSDQDFSGPV